MIRKYNFICPFCLHRFRIEISDNLKNIGCPNKECRKTIPGDFVIEILSQPFVIGSLIGRVRHGKTCFLTSIFYHIEYLRHHNKLLKKAGYSAIDTDAWKIIEDFKGKFRNGEVPEATQKQVNLVMTFEGIPHVRSFVLTLFDNGGETFDNIQAILDSKCLESDIIFFIFAPINERNIQLKNSSSNKQKEQFEIPSPEKGLELIRNYIHAYFDAGGKCKKKGWFRRNRVIDQKVIMILTKADLYKSIEGVALPEKMERYLQEDIVEYLNKKQLKELSQITRNWVEEIGYSQLIQELEKKFDEVVYVPVSALGQSREEVEKSRTITPKGSILPILWIGYLMHTSRLGFFKKLNLFIQDVVRPLANHVVEFFRGGVLGASFAGLLGIFLTLAYVIKLGVNQTKPPSFQILFRDDFISNVLHYLPFFSFYWGMVFTLFHRVEFNVRQPILARLFRSSLLGAVWNGLSGCILWFFIPAFFDFIHHQKFSLHSYVENGLSGAQYGAIIGNLIIPLFFILKNNEYFLNFVSDYARRTTRPIGDIGTPEFIEYILPFGIGAFVSGLPGVKNIFPYFTWILWTILSFFVYLISILRIRIRYQEEESDI